MAILFIAIPSMVAIIASAVLTSGTMLVIYVDNGSKKVYAKIFDDFITISGTASNKFVNQFFVFCKKLIVFIFVAIEIKFKFIV